MVAIINNRVKVGQETTVVEAALMRLRHVYETFPNVYVACSGGKDSTVLLELAAQESILRGEPLKLLYQDEEIIDPDTESYIHQLKQREDLVVHHLCLQMQHTLFGLERSHWYTWDDECPDVWFRPRPEDAITTEMLRARISNYRDRVGVRKLVKQYLNSLGDPNDTVVLLGVRAQESMNRVRSVFTAGGWLVKRGKGSASPRDPSHAYPIYDWELKDVWSAIKKFEWTYSRFYDKLHLAGVKPQRQRMSSWGNVSSIQAMAYYRELYPEHWNRALQRLPELQVMERYGQSRLLKDKKPDGVTWQEWCYALLYNMNLEDRQRWLKLIKNIVLRWERIHTIPFPEEPITLKDDSPVVGANWQAIAREMTVNDKKGRTMLL